MTFNLHTDIPYRPIRPDCPDCDGVGWVERSAGPKDTDVGVVRPLKCNTCHGKGFIDPVDADLEAPTEFQTE